MHIFDQFDALIILVYDHELLSLVVHDITYNNLQGLYWVTNNISEIMQKPTRLIPVWILSVTVVYNI